MGLVKAWDPRTQTDPSRHFTTTFSAADGIHVFARSLGTAQPIAGIPVALIARRNDELARVTTDATGRAHFAAGLTRGSGPAQRGMVMAFGASDFAVQDLNRPAFDLSDRGVDGRDAPGPVDALLYTERGIYRPGETVQRDGVLILGPMNLPSQLPYHASQMYSKNVQTFTEYLVKDGALAVDLEDPIVGPMCVTHGGQVRYGR